MEDAVEVVELAAEGVRALLPELAALLQDAVDNGASIGFLPPLAGDEACAYWQEIAAALETPACRLWVARSNGCVLGSVQLFLEPRPNGRHRAEVRKLIVHTGARRRGIGRTLMTLLEDEARRAARSLLVLDTAGDDAERLYLRLGYRRAGVIPGYALNGSGGADATILMYKQIG